MMLPTTDDKEVPRKRSKISRACDACRRKKIRCDAEYLALALKVAKLCTNCTKAGEKCTFSRVPMKRGPLKGYIRDLVDRMDEDPYHTRPRLKLVDAPPYAAPALPVLLVKPMLHRLPFPAAAATGATLPIILPPLLGAQPLTQPVKLSVPVNKASGSISPHTGLSALNKTKLPDSRILGPLWKVPYEMPTLLVAGLATSSPGSANGISFESRRSSVDSISSILTSGSRLRLPSLKPLVSVNSDTGVFDLDTDETYPPARAYSASLSPRNSVSSLLSLNGKVSSMLNISPPGQTLFAQPLPQQLGSSSRYQFPPLNQAQASPFQSAQPGPHPNEPVAIPLNPLEYNLHAYYSKFHLNFPILPFNEAVVPRLVAALLNESPQALQVLQLFNAALNNLIHYQFVPLEKLVGLLRHFLSLYPFNHYGLAAKDDLLIVMFASLIIINYTILLKGEVYSLGVSITAGVFNDFKVLENFADHCRSPNALDPDDIKIYLPRLYLCLFVIDNCSSVSFGCQSQLAGSFDLLTDNVAKIFPDHVAKLPFKSNLSAAKMLHTLIGMRGQVVYSTSSLPKKYPRLAASLSFEEPTFGLLWGNMICDKYELYNFLLELVNFFESLNDSKTEDDDTVEHLYDYQLKTSRLVKKLTQSILSFANYVSTIYSQTNSPSSPQCYNLINPFFNVSFGQSFKLIKACKLLVDSLIEHVNDNEIITRSVKINNDLSIAFNLLVSNLNNNFNSVVNAKNSLNNQAKSNGFSQAFPPANNPANVNGLGVTCMSLISNKLDLYGLSFTNVPAKAELSSKEDYKKNLSAWKKEFMSTIVSFVLNEGIDGWY